ncbi:phage baseplate assembly protein V [Methylobacterium sp. J-090]|uniref:phage baseplate assembly protein V n=1 Tax=Methylobacterium sp. J-090 TaxID=2836666 RepID=UPI001FBA99FF|nr:phage baseplate assembly protein V [Methylobacterium sp. J-090]MCJ2080172.1 phage baseplate assembly protein V [Methylobacterium sp. J-090]
MTDFMDLVGREVLMTHLPSPNRMAEVTSYNEKTHAVKLKIMPEGIETGWAPLGSIAIGNGFGVAVGAKAGDMVMVAYPEGDHSSPIVISRVFSDVQKAPKVKGGEMVIWHESGTRDVYSEDGSHTKTHATGGTMTWDKNGTLVTDNGDKTVATAAGQVTTVASKTIQHTAGKILLNC